ncbi:hypothetical protein MJO28_010676 [Puccinia striiformis f. sp. tritici]|uniref:Uncharacterized protein n=1 Tax=Puccinia striiformis f. sp. tritici TaxID=168172 RepID=A0ACC0E5Q4_9BASI|nr:hypothetical protein Pst134EA_019485 [Puccinia striiformis f. sp. tritici]KAH9459332.1 hypothetical protein Pst134EA_019485 [Puccinia striiformis f. sp. tritici]KAI7944981.1 hypothetical protein MJO28_010676 [Puccinia striiformis f. sp. tritici]
MKSIAGKKARSDDYCHLTQLACLKTNRPVSPKIALSKYPYLTKPRGELDDAFNQLFQIHSPTASSLGRSVRNIASIYLRHFIKPSVDCLWFRLWTIYILLPNLSLACNQSIPLQLPAKLVIRLFVVSLSIAHTG